MTRKNTDGPGLVTPETRIGDLLKDHPELEDFLVEQAPAFTALKNPVLRRTVGRVATVAQAAKVGGVPIGTLLNAIRERLGQPLLGADTGRDEAAEERPSWLNGAEPAVTLDADAMLASAQTPVREVQDRLGSLSPGQLLRLDASFQPVPLMDALRRKGYEVHAEPDGETWAVWIRVPPR